MSAVPISMRVISHQKVERRLPGSFTFPIVMSKFCHRQIRGPIILLMVNKEPEIGLHPLIVALQLSVHSGVVHGRNVLCDPQYAAYFSCEFGCEPGVSITNDLAGKSEAFEHMSDEDSGCFF